MKKIKGNNKEKCSNLWITSALACLLILFQLSMLLGKGEIICLNNGCRIVEDLLLVSPVFFNLLGLCFFLSIVILSVAEKNHPSFSRLIDILLISGAVSEGVLVGFQLFVAKTLCSYCLMVCALIFLLILLRKKQVLLYGASFFCVELIVFSLLRFDVIPANLPGMGLDLGTYAIKTCSSPVKQVYLIFSKDCSHCKKVIDALEGCSRCEFHFNPISRVDKKLLPDLSLAPSYNPSINRTVLKLLGIEKIPVLLAKDFNGITFIQGDKNIISYVKDVCFSYNPLYEEHFSDFSNGQDGGVCSADEKCKD